MTIIIRDLRKGVIPIQTEIAKGRVVQVKPIKGLPYHAVKVLILLDTGYEIEMTANDVEEIYKALKEVEEG
ncbi:hypothetical protein J7L00_03495 [Candidatus Bathyarchaeota archaeon]|nr:hypothetical protein [Candidatus Bathyarchaeota archaeon]